MKNVSHKKVSNVSSGQNLMKPSFMFWDALLRDNPPTLWLKYYTIKLAE